MKIAVCRLERLGDIVAAEPIVRHLTKAYPGAEIHWYTTAKYAELVRANPFVTEVHEIACLCEWTMARRIIGYDKTFGLHMMGDGCSLHKVPLRALDVDGNAAVNFSNYYQHRNLLTMFCRVAGLPAEIGKDGPRWHSRRERAYSASWAPKRFVAFHAVSEDRIRDWTDEKWRDLGDAVEKETGHEMLEIAPDMQLDHHGIAELIRRAECFVGIDSGPAHIANAVGTPGVVLLSKYLWFPHTYMPYSGAYEDGSNATMVRHQESVKAISVDDVVAAVVGRLRSKERAREG